MVEVLATILLLPHLSIADSQTDATRQANPKPSFAESIRHQLPGKRALDSDSAYKQAGTVRAIDCRVLNKAVSGTSGREKRRARQPGG